LVLLLRFLARVMPGRAGSDAGSTSCVRQFRFTIWAYDPSVVPDIPGTGKAGGKP
jgi:hypothetical protein